MAKILYLSTERNIDMEKKHKIMYLDYNSKEVGGFPQEIYQKIKDFDPDFLIEREFNDGVSKYPDIVTYVRDNISKCIRAVWLIDNHCNSQWHLEYAPLFDYAFCAISTFVPVLASHLRNIGSKTKVFWLPLCYPYRMDKIIRNKSKVEYDVVFVGRWGGWFKERTELLEKLKARYGEKMFMITDYADMESHLRRGVISFNRSISYDMNFRVFESLANGIELVTNDVPDIHLIHTLPERINIYHSEEELYQLIDDILAGKLENDVIKSQIWVQNHHCLIHRHKEMLKMMAHNEQYKY